MFYRVFGESATRMLEKAMDTANLRSQLIGQNVANVNTPGYKRLDVNFAAVLDEQTQQALPLAISNGKHYSHSNLASPAAPPIIRDNQTATRADGNNVDVEYEIAQIAQNSLYFQAVTSSWKKHMNKLRLAIDGRG